MESTWIYFPGATDISKRPPSLWRIDRMMFDSIAALVLGQIPLNEWQRCPERFVRHLCDTNRHRVKQSAAASFLKLDYG